MIIRKYATMIWGSLLLVLCADTSTAQQGKEEFLYFADPTIFYNKGSYYLYGTNGRNSDAGFYAMQSDDLLHWNQTNNGQLVLKNGESYGTKGFWAPHVFKHKRRLYMVYTANENIAIAIAPSPQGPFRQQVKEPLKALVKQIDPFVFRDDDGKLYLYHVRLQNGNRIFGAVLRDNLSGIYDSTLRECISVVNDPQPWENTLQVPWTVAEGPTVIKADKKYIMFYSANDFRNPDYAVGYAMADHPLGPWKKSANNPLISRVVTKYNGSGHGDLIRDKSGQYYYVLHVHNSQSAVAPRKTAIIKLSTAVDNKGVPEVNIDAGSFRLLQGAANH